MRFAAMTAVATPSTVTAAIAAGTTQEMLLALCAFRRLPYLIRPSQPSPAPAQHRDRDEARLTLRSRYPTPAQLITMPPPASGVLTSWRRIAAPDAPTIGATSATWWAQQASIAPELMPVDPAVLAAGPAPHAPSSL